MNNSGAKMLFNLLDKIGASEKMRQLYKDKARNLEIMKHISCKEKGVCYNFGSSSEGTTTPGLNSDFDYLICLDIPAVLDLEEAKHHKYAALIFEDLETAPGYVKLQMTINGLVAPFDDEHDYAGLAQQDRNGIYCLKNILDQFALTKPFMIEVHGPAETSTDRAGVHVDDVRALRCITWPSFAKEWLERKRPFAWPEKHVIDHCQRLGFFLVKVGHPYSKDKDIEWRVSFSLQERLLMFNLTDVQHKCYIMLKLIKRDLIEGKIGKSITSYHCKTCIFYAIEQNPQSIWSPENLFECVIICLKLLISWTKNRHCPNYFIPNENMFDGKVVYEIQNALKDILSEGESFLERMTTDNVGYHYIHRNDEFELDKYENLSHQNVSCAIYKLRLANVQCVLYHILIILNERVFQGNIPQIKVNGEFRKDVQHAIESHQQILDSLSSIESIHDYSTAEIKDVIEPIFPFIDSSLAGHYLSLALQCDDDSQKKKNMSLAGEEFQKGISSDFASGRLKYVTYLFTRGMYDECEQELVSLETQFSKPFIPMSPTRPTTEESPNISCDLRNKIKNENYCTKYILQHHVCAAVVFLPTELNIIPDALKFEMFRSACTPTKSRDNVLTFWHHWVVVDGNVYMYFLWYLLKRAIHASIAERCHVIIKLKLATENGVIHKDTSYNLLAWAYSSEGLVASAIGNLMLSWITMRHLDLSNFNTVAKAYKMQHNAVKWHMLLLLHDIWFSKRLFNSKAPPFCFKCINSFLCDLPKCPKCKIAQYCSTTCQEMDLEIHKKICKQVRCSNTIYKAPTLGIGTPLFTLLFFAVIFFAYFIISI